MSERRPNIVFMFSDQHAASFTGCYGDRWADTPNIDRLAQTGCLFENAYCPSPLCVPARMAMLTAQYPHDIGVHTNRDYLKSDTPTFVHALGIAGYRTSLIGRMHFIGPDQHHGFQERPFGDISVNWPGSPLIDYGNLNRARGTKGPTLQYAGKGETIIHKYDRAVTKSAVEFIDQLGKSGDSRPFFMTIGWYGPHPPYIALEEDYAYFDGQLPPPRHASPNRDREHPYLKSWRKQAEFEAIPDNHIRNARTAYYGNVRMIDRQVGKVIEALKKNNLDGNTLIVYASDHGEQLGERGFWQKNTFYEHSIKVPLVWNWPGQTKSQQRRTEVVNLIDMATSFIDVAKAPELPNGKGRSFLDLVRGETIDWENLTFSEFYGGLVSIKTSEIANRMLRTDRYKYIYYHGFPGQLFDMTEDPFETTDLIEDPTYRNIARELRNMVLKGWSPEQLTQRIANKERDVEILKNWTKIVQPAESHRWPKAGPS